MRAVRALRFGLLHWLYGSESKAEISQVSRLSYTRKLSNLRVKLQTSTTGYSTSITLTHPILPRSNINPNLENSFFHESFLIMLYQILLLSVVWFLFHDLLKKKCFPWALQSLYGKRSSWDKTERLFLGVKQIVFTAFETK